MAADPNGATAAVSEKHRSFLYSGAPPVAHKIELRAKLDSHNLSLNCEELRVDDIAGRTCAFKQLRNAECLAI